MQAADWTVGDRDFHLGSPLAIRLPEGADRVRILYRTQPQASGLQWLTPEQTAGGRHPFLYTQAQAIHARTFLPCQDSPGVRLTFTATVHAPPPLTAVMAAVRRNGHGPDDDGWTAFSFEMAHSIPTYLIALAVGELAFEKVPLRLGFLVLVRLIDEIMPDRVTSVLSSASARSFVVCEAYFSMRSAY